MKILLSTGVLKGHDIGAVMKLAAKLKLDGIELITANLDAPFDMGMMNKLQRLHRTKIWTVHMPFFSKGLLGYVLNPMSRSNEMVEFSVRLASGLGARNIVIHPFPAIIIKGRIRDVMKSVLKSHKSKDVEFSIENMEVRHFLGFGIEPYCISEHDDIHRFCAENDFSMTLDTAHCMSKGIDPSAFFEKYGKLINNIHLSNFKDRQAHNPLDNGIIDFRKLFRTIGRSRYDGCLTLEINPTTRKEVVRNVGLMREYLD